MECSHEVHPVADRVCELPPASPGPDDVFLNALADNMPACDRRNDRMARLDGIDHAATCYVYCAQRSCQAANDFMENNAPALRDKCEAIVYLHNGALSMAADDLADGQRCHADIVDFNRRDPDHACLTCRNETSSPIALEIDGTSVSGRLLETDDEIPDWYIRHNIYSPLPPQFTCDKRYAYPLTMHADGASTVKVRLPDDARADSVIAFWAAKPASSVREAHEAYGDFANSGIVQCAEHVCEMKLDLPGVYTADGEVFPAHVHFTEWEGDRWNRVAKTINFPEHLFQENIS